MNAPERRKKIVDIVNHKGTISVSDLSKELETSEVTIRSDIKFLSEKNLLVRFYGGATSLQKGSISQPNGGVVLSQENSRKSIQRDIAKKAMALIKNHDTIIIGSGTTNAILAEEIVKKGFSSLTVITNNIMAITTLHQNKNIILIVLGGRVAQGNSSTYSDIAEKAIENMKIDFMFTGADGLDESGVTSNHEGFSLSATLARYSREVIVITESFKLGKRCMNKVLELDQISKIITEKNENPNMSSFKEKIVLA